MKNGNNELNEDYKKYSRETLLKTNGELIEQLEQRILKTKRFRAAEDDGVKLSYIRVFVQALLCMNQLLKDSELDDIQKRLEALENAKGA